MCCSYPSISYIINREIAKTHSVVHYPYVSHIFTNTVLFPKNTCLERKHTMLCFICTYLSCTGSQTHIYGCPRKHTFFISMYCKDLSHLHKHAFCYPRNIHNGKTMLFTMHTSPTCSLTGILSQKKKNGNTLRVHIHICTVTSTCSLSVKKRPAKHNSILLLYVTLMSSPTIVRLSQKN
jgi:hypothetical protein